MTSPLQARQAAIEAVARAEYEAFEWSGCAGSAWERIPLSVRDGYLDRADIAVQVLLGTPDTPCPECDHGLAELRFPDADASWNRGFPKTGKGMCPNCHGTSVVPGTSGLRVPCDNPDCVKGTIYEMPPGFNIGSRLPCPDCTDGLGLAAIDVARGTE